MTRTKWSHDIEESLIEQFNELAKELPGKKYEVIEAMIMAFRSLPGGLQENLLSKRADVRAAALDVLAGLGVGPAPARVNRRTRRSKAG